jgi:uncharacterized repeat protein (TIGR01451 family)
VLPAPQTDAHGIINTYYAIYFPPNVTITAGSAQSCVSGGFCAYHSDTASLIPYGVVPDFSAGNCRVGCGLGTLFQNLTHASSHEMGEAVTDAEVGTAGPFAPPLGWYDFPPNLGEIADICGILAAGITAGANNYTVEPLFSNLQNDCVTSPPDFKITPPAQAGPGVAFNATLAVNGSASFAPITTYTDIVHFTSSDSLAVLPTDYTFVAGDAGVHTFSFTLNTPGNQTITATDTRFSSFNGSATLNVNNVPDLTIAKKHGPDFVVGQTGAYTIQVSNIGGGTTSGTVTVTDTLPPGLAGTAIGGTGWSCTLATLTCTRTDGLAANHSYPAIALAVSVTAPSPTNVINTATVSGGNDGNPLNNTANDPTAIIAPIVDLRTTISANSSVIAGTNGFIYTITITNAGALPSSGEVILNTDGPFSVVSISGAGWACSPALLSGQCIRTDSVAPGQSYPVITVTTNVSPISPGLSFLLAAIAGGGNSGTNNSASFTVTVNPPVSIISNTPGVTVIAGQPAQYTIGLQIGPAVGNVPFSCSGLPTGTTCSFSPASLSGSGNVVMTVSTTARSSVVRLPTPGNRIPLIFLALLSVAALILLGLYGQPRLARKLIPILGAAALLTAMLAGCGGGGGGTPGPSPNPNPAAGTPAGTYGITFTATGPFGKVNRPLLLVVK